MAIPRVKNWVAGEVLTANDLNNEFNNLANTSLIEPFVATQPVDLNGQLLILDADGDTLLDPSGNNIIDITIGGEDDFRFAPNSFTALPGSVIVVEDGDLIVSDGNVVVSNGRVLEADGGEVFSATAITVPTTGHTFTITGTTDIASFSETQIGTMLHVKFTGAGLNILYTAVSMIGPWGVDYRTVQDELLCFLSLGSGNYMFWSLNGPKERTGQTIEHNSTTVPAGFLEENSTAVSRTTYSGLFATISTTFGVGDGSTTFNVPDSRGRAVVNVDGTADRLTAFSLNGTNANTLGGVGGLEYHQQTVAEMAPHTHTERYAIPAGGTSGARMAVVSQATSAETFASIATETASSGGNAFASNTQPWIAKKKYIRW